MCSEQLVFFFVFTTHVTLQIFNPDFNNYVEPGPPIADLVDQAPQGTPAPTAPLPTSDPSPQPRLTTDAVTTGETGTVSPTAPNGTPLLVEISAEPAAATNPVVATGATPAVITLTPSRAPTPADGKGATTTGGDPAAPTTTGGGPFVRQGSDLFLIDLGNAYLVEALTEKGMRFGENRYLKAASPEDSALADELEKKACRKMESTAHPGLSVEGIEKRLDALLESPFWDRLHEKCIGCNTCTFLCPTCHCFDIADEASGNKGQRVRSWDSCQSPLYSLETSGHNPRSTGRERTRQRIMHKLNYFPKLFGKIACVGCGRCVLYCPVNFDIRRAIEEIQNAKE